MNEYSEKSDVRSALSFEDFVEAATAAALRASIKVAGQTGRRVGGGDNPRGPHLPWPGIWVGIVIRTDSETVLTGTAGTEQQ